jgi:hypothetical protein
MTSAIFMRSLALAAFGAAISMCPSAAVAAPTATSTLVCGAQSFTIDGFGRGQVLHVTGTKTNFVVTRAVLSETGDIVFDLPAAVDRSLLTCTTLTPASNTAFTFTGFFTPRV